MVNSIKNINTTQGSSSTLSGNRKTPKTNQRGIALRSNSQDQNAYNNKNENSSSEFTQIPDQNSSVRSNENNAPKDKEEKVVSSKLASLAFSIFGATNTKVSKEMNQAKITAEFRRLQTEGIIAAAWLEVNKQIGAIAKAGVDTIVQAGIKIANLTKQGQS